MNAPSFDESPYLLWLVGWRALLGFSALYTILEKPLSTSLLVLSALLLLLMFSEGAYRQIIAYKKAKLRKQWERELKEKHAEEARLRYEQMQQKKASLMSLDDDEEVPGGGANATQVPNAAVPPGMPPVSPAA